eukprot:4686965-Lingulodinium_polyedra.AAC.1
MEAVMSLVACLTRTITTTITITKLRSHFGSRAWPVRPPRAGRAWTHGGYAQRTCTGGGGSAACAELVSASGRGFRTGRRASAGGGGD